MSMLRKEVNSLLVKMQNGDEESKNVLFEKTYNHLKIVVYPYLRNKNDLEDVLEETYLRIFKYYKSFDPNKDGYNWICKIAQNVALDWDRSPQCVSLDEVKECALPNDLEEEFAAKDEVKRLLQEYSERDQRIMYLRFWMDITIEEIARLLGMGKSNVHKRISKITKEKLAKKRERVEK